MNRKVRSIVRVGGSRAAIIPKDFFDKHPDCKKVTVVYNDIILIFPEDQAARVDQLFEQLIAKVASETLTREGVSSHDRTD